MYKVLELVVGFVEQDINIRKLKMYIKTYQCHCHCQENILKILF